MSMPTLPIVSNKIQDYCTCFCVRVLQRISRTIDKPLATRPSITEDHVFFVNFEYAVKLVPRAFGKNSDEKLVSFENVLVSNFTLRAFVKTKPKTGTLNSKLLCS